MKNHDGCLHTRVIFLARWALNSYDNFILNRREKQAAVRQPKDGNAHDHKN